MLMKAFLLIFLVLFSFETRFHKASCSKLLYSKIVRTKIESKSQLTDTNKRWHKVVLKDRQN